MAPFQPSCVCVPVSGVRNNKFRTPHPSQVSTHSILDAQLYILMHTQKKRGDLLSQTTIPLLFPNMHAHMSNYIVCSLSSGFNTSSHNTWIVLPLCVALPASCPCHHEKCFLYFNTMKHRTYSKRWWFTMRALPVICKINATGRPSVLQNILSSKRTGMVLKTEDFFM